MSVNQRRKNKADMTVSEQIEANPRRYRNNNFHGQLIKIVALPSGEKLEIKEHKEVEKQEVGLPGQMSIEDYMKEGNNAN